jgi:hypothetical protein
LFGALFAAISISPIHRSNRYLTRRKARPLLRWNANSLPIGCQHTRNLSFGPFDFFPALYENFIGNKEGQRISLKVYFYNVAVFNQTDYSAIPCLGGYMPTQGPRVAPENRRP